MSSYTTTIMIRGRPGKLSQRVLTRKNPLPVELRSKTLNRPTDKQGGISRGMTITCNVENVTRHRVEGFLGTITKCLGGEYACDVTSCCSRVVGVAENTTSVVVALHEWMNG